MSAALVLAAVRLDIPRLRYLYGDRDMRGTVLAGTEQVGEIRTDLVTVRRRLDLVVDLMRHGDFGAAIPILQDLDGPFGALWPVIPAERGDGPARYRSGLRCVGSVGLRWCTPCDGCSRHGPRCFAGRSPAGRRHSRLAEVACGRARTLRQEGVRSMVAGARLRSAGQCRTAGARPAFRGRLAADVPDPRADRPVSACSTGVTTAAAFRPTIPWSRSFVANSGRAVARISGPTRGPVT